VSGFETITLTRDCEAALIPMGTPLMLQAGQQVVITQSLGGSFTVNVNGNLARIAAKDANALGKPTPTQALPHQGGGIPCALPPSVWEGSDGGVTEESVWEQLRTCFDPEIPVNIVDLGLIYHMKITPLPPSQSGLATSSAGSRVDIKMTLTAPGCGMGEILKEDVQGKVISIPGVESCHVELVTEPLWNQAMMSDAGKLELGML